jgi:hypothetical protein
MAHGMRDSISNCAAYACDYYRQSHYPLAVTYFEKLTTFLNPCYPRIIPDVRNRKRLQLSFPSMSYGETFAIWHTWSAPTHVFRNFDDVNETPSQSDNGEEI